jgi:hypothetical protein
MTTTPIPDEVFDKVKVLLVGCYDISLDGENHWINKNKNKAFSIYFNNSDTFWTPSCWLYLIQKEIKERPRDTGIKRTCNQQHCINPQHQLLTSTSWSSFQREDDWLYLESVIKNNTKTEGEHLVWTGYSNKENGPLFNNLQITRLVYMLKDRKDIQSEHNVFRTCDNKNCIATLHLTLKKLNYNPVTAISAEFCEEARKFIQDCLTNKDDGHWVTKYKGRPYPSAMFQGTRWRLNRLSWTAFNDKLPPENLVARHNCPVKHCVNPKHLEIGTSADNAADRIRDDKHNRGKRCHSCIIDKDTARQIKKSRGNGTQQERATRHGTTLATVQSIDRGKSWAYVNIESDSEGSDSSEEEEEEKSED